MDTYIDPVERVKAFDTSKPRNAPLTDAEERLRGELVLAMLNDLPTAAAMIVEATEEQVTEGLEASRTAFVRMGRLANTIILSLRQATAADFRGGR